MHRKLGVAEHDKVALFVTPSSSGGSHGPPMTGRSFPRKGLRDTECRGGTLFSGRSATTPADRPSGHEGVILGIRIGMSQTLLLASSADAEDRECKLTRH